MAATSYPLQWPQGWARSPYRIPSRYRLKLTDAVNELLSELERLDTIKGSIVISSNVPPKNGKGTPKNDGAYVEDPGVSVWWTSRKHGQKVIACDKWSSVRENVRALALSLQALRSLERAGATQVLERTFESFAALPSAPPPKQWWEVMEFTEEEIWTLTEQEIQNRYRNLAKKAHPDQGGSVEAMSALNQARDIALETTCAR